MCIHTYILGFQEVFTSNIVREPGMFLCFCTIVRYYMYVCMYVCVCVCVRYHAIICMYACMYVYIYVCMHVMICMHACVHVFMHEYL